MRYTRLLAVAGLLCIVAPLSGRVGARVDPVDTKLLTQPAISATHIAFIYAGDLFTADLDGTNVRRLTTDDGVESNPVFSPDGKTIAFSAQYDGNTDVYTVPLAGGPPVRLTWHPGADSVQSFTPDGKAVLFTSQRATFTARYTQLFTVPTAGGMEDAAADPERGPGHLLARRQPHRLQPDRRAVSAVEALPRRHDPAAVALRHEEPRHRKDPAAEGALQRHRSDVDRRHGVLPLRPRRRVQPVRLRHADQGRSGS